MAGAFLFSELTPWLRLGDGASTRFLRLLAAVRTPWLTDVAKAINAAGSGWGVTVVGLSVVVLTMIFRRWRHLLVFVSSFFFLVIVGRWIYSGLSRPRPYGVPIIASWGGYSAPSPPVATLTIFLMGAVYCLVVPGRPRTYAKALAAVVIAMFCLARVYLAIDHPDDVLFGVALGVAIPVTAFRYFTPNAVFPVVYRRGKTAHVDVTGRRGEAIRTAIHDQLGLQRWSVQRVGLACAMLGATAIVVVVGGQAFFPAGNIGAYPPQCGTGHSMILAAQAVPSAALVPCVAALPSGWQVGGADIASGHARFWLDSDQAGPQAVTVTLSAACDVSGARQIPSDQPGTRRFERPLSLGPQFADLRFYIFPGGCATYRFSFAPGASPLLAIPIDSAVAFVPRARLVDHVRSTEGLALCGRGAACPG